MRRELGHGPPADGLAPPTPADHAVVVEHRHAVGREPHVALETGAPMRQASTNASRVFSGAWARAPRWAKRIGSRERWVGPSTHPADPAPPSDMGLRPLMPAPRRADALKVMLVDREGGL